MVRKLGIIALLALIIIPAGVMAAGFQGDGAGSQTATGNGKQYAQQSGDSQSFQGQYAFCSKNGFEISAEKGNGELLRTRSCDQQGDQDRDQTRIRARLKDGSCGNCPATLRTATS